MKRINIVTLILVFTSLVFTNCNTAKRTSMSVAQLDRISPIQAKPIIDTAHFSYALPKQLPPKITDTKHDFQLAYQELKAMLQGTQPPDFERAVYLSENPYHNNQFTYKQFQQMVDIPLSAIQALIAVNDKSDTMNFDVKVSANGTFKMADMRFLPKEKKELYKKTLGNWAIFTYITDTLTFRVGDSKSPFLLYHLPFAYTTEDPFGKNDWTSTQVINLLTNGEQGNCYSLTALFKILSNRLHTDTRLCTAPQHVYIQHRDTKGDYYNIELATAGFPRDGTLQTLTYTTDEAIKNGIALRDYTERQSIGLCMVNLAKSYEHYYETKDDAFLMQCAETVLQYDSLNLSALLLKEQVLDERVSQYAKQKNISNITILKQDKNIVSTISDLEQHTNLLYRLGYRQMPVDMQQIILSGNHPTAFADQNPSPYSNPRISKEEKLGKYQALYGGLFKEVFEQQATEAYRHFVFDTKTKKLKSINTAAQENELIDPVAFAYDFGARMYDARLGRWMSTDPLQTKYPLWSPYSSFANNPVLLIDKDGEEPTKENATGLTAYIVKLNQENIQDLNQLKNIHGTGYGGFPHYSHNDAISGALTERYLYSKKWGWIDMKHFSAAAEETDKWYKSAENVLDEGEKVEYRQEHRIFPNNRDESHASAWDYEDLVSNLLGVGFEAYLETDEAAGLDLVTNLKNYLTDLGFVDDPKEAQGYNNVIDTHADESNITNYTYDPKFAPDKDKRTTKTDKMVLDILDKHQGKDTDRRVAIARKQENKVGPGF